MAKGIVRSLFGGACSVCREMYGPNELVFPWGHGYVCVPCQRDLNDRAGRW